MSIKGIMTMDKERVHFNLAKIRKGGKNFEVAVDADLAIKLRNRENIDIKEIVKSEHIFCDVKKGLLAEDSHLEELFGTKDIDEVASKIITEGELQLTLEYKNRLREEKIRKVISLIARNAVDPKTNLPHPPQRIENAMKEAKVRVDEHKNAEEQIEKIVEKLKPIIPIKIETKRIRLKFPSKYAAKAYGAVSLFGQPKNEAWNNDGSYECEVSIPPGLEPEMYEKLNSMTHGEIEAKAVK